jgi:hypothetical protein
MEKSYFKIEHTPAILWGGASDKIYLSVHGKNGSKEEAAGFAEIVCAGGWQVLSIDLPEHGERGSEKDAFDPWHVVPELRNALLYLKTEWKEIGLQATSIGAWFSLLAFGAEAFEKCLFVSPVLDMEHLIRNMMGWASVAEETLRQKREIKTDFGETLSWEYLTYVRAHPILKWDSPTAILYAGKDSLTERYVVDAFCARFHADLSVMAAGEHWFHTPEQLSFLEEWTRSHT